MSVETQEILGRALKLSAVDKARLVDELLSSLDKPDEAIDALGWLRRMGTTASWRTMRSPR